MAGKAIPYVDSDMTAGGGDEPGSQALVKYVVPPALQQFLNSVGFPFDSQQLEKAETLAKSMGIPFSAGKGELPQDYDRLGGTFGMAQLFIRRKVNQKPLQMEGFRFATDKNTRTLYEDDGLYAAGFIDR